MTVVSLDKSLRRALEEEFRKIDNDLEEIEERQSNMRRRLDKLEKEMNSYITSRAD